MNRLSSLVSDLDSASPVLMTHVVVGYPTLEKSLEIVRAMAKSGAALIELQIPFSDPMADGPSIMGACEVALEQGVAPEDCMEAMATLSSELSVPLLFMSYLNIPLNYEGGLQGFVQAAEKAGATGLIIPDIPPEETAIGYYAAVKESSLLHIPLVAPVSSDARLAKVSANTQEGTFVYCVSTTGITGARAELPEGLPVYLAKVKNVFHCPRALGFGLSKPEHIKALQGHAEIAVVGSAVIDVIKRTEGDVSAVAEYITELASC